MGKLIDETDLMNLLYALDDARHDLCYAIKKIPELPTVEAIPKDQYEARLKADLKAILVELQLEIGEKEQYYQDKFLESENGVHDLKMAGRMFGCGECKDLIQQKIDKLKGVEE